ncbi:MAG: hypothetical protein IPK64_19755 [bacterium]|nr:hypothetical protein [bacterium]
MDLFIHRVERIEISEPVEHTGDHGTYAVATLRIGRGSDEPVVLQLFAPTKDRLRVLGSDLATLMQVEARA